MARGDDEALAIGADDEPPAAADRYNSLSPVYCAVHLSPHFNPASARARSIERTR
jgi:hypothetical protein